MNGYSHQFVADARSVVLGSALPRQHARTLVWDPTTHAETLTSNRRKKMEHPTATLGNRAAGTSLAPLLPSKSGQP